MTEDFEIAKSIEQNGWHAIAVDDEDIPFVYTCGLQFKYNHSDLAIFGLSAKMAYPILSQMINEIKTGQMFEENRIYDNVLNVPVFLRPIDKTQHTVYFGYAMGHRRFIGQAGTLVIRQVYWPDRNGYFPFEVGCDPKVCQMQPRLEFLSLNEDRET